MLRKLTLCLFALFATTAAYCQKNDLKAEIARIAKSSKGIVGVSILNLETRDSLSFNGNSQLVMESVYKFPIGMYFLHLVDDGKMKLDQKIRFSKKDLPETFSPLRDKYPNGGEIPLSDMLAFMVSESDNDACDILIKKAGGAQVIESYMFSIGIKGISIKATEAEMGSSWEVQYNNWCKPVAITHLLDIFYNGKVLKKASNDFLWDLMVKSVVGPKRIKGLLPDGIVVAHRTGTSSTNSEGLAPGTNDAGIIVLPNGQHLAISIMVCNSSDDMDGRELTIAKIAKAAYDAYAK